MKNREIKWILGFGVALVALLLTAPALHASNAISKKENGMVCTTCHDKPGSKLLTDQGKYYELMGDLDGLAQLESEFSKCTRCHKRKPGSTKLTSVGERYRWMIEDMQGLKSWLQEQHPSSGPERNEARPNDGKR